MLNVVKQLQDINNDENGDADLTGNITTNDVIRQSPTLQKCTISSCKSVVSEYMLKCAKCSRLTHYSCTRLPTYQLIYKEEISIVYV